MLVIRVHRKFSRTVDAELTDLNCRTFFSRPVMEIELAVADGRASRFAEENCKELNEIAFGMPKYDEFPLVPDFYWFHFINLRLFPGLQNSVKQVDRGTETESSRPGVNASHLSAVN